MSDSKEKTIIGTILAGETDEYRFFVERYHRGLIQHLFNFLHDADLAEDIAQEAFIRAFEKLGRYNPAYAFSTWLYKIADNIALEHLRRQKPTTDLADVAATLADHHQTPPEAVETKLQAWQTREAIKRLPPAYRQIVGLYYWDNCSYQEIADIIDRPIGTVRTWLFRAKEILRKELYGQV